MVSQLMFTLSNEMCSAEVVLFLQERVKYDELAFTVPSTYGNVLWQAVNMQVVPLSNGNRICCYMFDKNTLNDCW